MHQRPRDVPYYSRILSRMQASGRGGLRLINPAAPRFLHALQPLVSQPRFTRSSRKPRGDSTPSAVTEKAQFLAQALERDDPIAMLGALFRNADRQTCGPVPQPNARFRLVAMLPAGSPAFKKCDLGLRNERLAIINLTRLRPHQCR